MYKHLAEMCKLRARSDLNQILILKEKQLKRERETVSPKC